MISNYITIDRVIEKINRFKIPGGYWNIEELKEWTYDALGAINDKTVRIKTYCYIEIVDNKGKIPADVEVIDTVLTSEGKVLQENIPYKDLLKTEYEIHNGFIYTNFNSGKDKLTVNYYTVPLDENGNPLIPDNRLYIAAIEAFLQYMIAKRAFMQGKILLQQLQMLEQEWLFYLPAAINSQKLDIMKDPNRFSKIHHRYRF
jgi:hypothetical protein